MNGVSNTSSGWADGVFRSDPPGRKRGRKWRRWSMVIGEGGQAGVSGIRVRHFKVVHSSRRMGEASSSDYEI